MLFSGIWLVAEHILKINIVVEISPYKYIHQKVI